MQYRIEFAPLAQRQFKKLDRVVQNRLLQRIETLSSNPRPPGVKKLTDEENLYRIRIGEYRVIYQIRDWVLTVAVVKIGHRRETNS
jgi:mRNA interferase RelE/StbE